MQTRQLKLNKIESDTGECVLYVMSRDQRVYDNHALLLAQEAALQSSIPLLVQFNVNNAVGVRSYEHYEFMLRGLVEIEQTLRKLHITFIVTTGDALINITDTVNKYNVQQVIFDFSPLRGARNMQKRVAKDVVVPCSVVDTHNIIPAWVLSDKEEYAAHTIRRKVHNNLAQWLQPPQPVVPHPYPFAQTIPVIDWQAVETYILAVKKCGIVVRAVPGEKAAHLALDDFINKRLHTYVKARNIPTEDGQSNLSPYLHFGQLSSLKVALSVIEKAPRTPLLFEEGKLASYEGEPTLMDSINALLEELIVRKELADNFCLFNNRYDTLDSGKDWALKSLRQHENDQREHVYSLEEWENAKTHDLAWNASQLQLRKTGKIHGYMRMYWAKKILEWSASPAEAMRTALYLNDHYSIDGGDPNGYVGILWSMCGIHDRPWFERPVFGVIRYMNVGGLERKFDVKEYIRTWDDSR